MHKNRVKQQSKEPQFETNPERIALIRETINHVIDIEGSDALCQDDEARDLAERVRLPYVEIRMIISGGTNIAPEDIDAYTAWRTACAKGGAQ